MKKRKDTKVMKNVFVNADDVAKELGVSKAYAYKVIYQMNEELAKKGYLTIAGKVSRQYFKERYYGMGEEE